MWNKMSKTKNSNTQSEFKFYANGSKLIIYIHINHAKQAKKTLVKETAKKEQFNSPLYRQVSGLYCAE